MMILYAQSWGFNLIGGGFRESKRAMQLSELLGLNISPSQVQLWIFLRFFFKCYFSLPFFNFHLYEFSSQWVISHDMNLLLTLLCNCFFPLIFFSTILMQVLQGHSPFKQLVNRYAYRGCGINSNIVKMVHVCMGTVLCIKHHGIGKGIVLCCSHRQIGVLSFWINMPDIRLQWKLMLSHV